MLNIFGTYKNRTVNALLLLYIMKTKELVLVRNEQIAVVFNFFFFIIQKCALNSQMLVGN